MFYSGDMKKINLILVSLFAAGGLAFNSLPALAADTMTQIHQLDFGTFALLNNAAAHTIVITPANGVTYDPAIISGSTPNRGEYTLALPGVPNMALTLGVTVVTLPNQGGMEVNNSSDLSLAANPLLTIDTFTTNNPSTDGSGNATLYIGATLHTSGTGSTYGNGTYNGTYDITVYF
jgi:hypothetical protein